MPSQSASQEALLAQAIGLYNDGRRSEARDAARKALPHPAAHQLLAVQCLDEGKPLDATRHVEASLKLRPGHVPTLRIGARAWFALAVEEHGIGDLAAEAAALRQALAMWPELVEAQVNLGIVLQSQGRLEEAMACYGRAYRLREDSLPRIAWALCSERRGAMWLRPQALRETLTRA